MWVVTKKVGDVLKVRDEKRKHPDDRHGFVSYVNSPTSTYGVWGCGKFSFIFIFTKIFL